MEPRYFGCFITNFSFFLCLSLNFFECKPLLWCYPDVVRSDICIMFFCSRNGKAIASVLLTSILVRLKETGFFLDGKFQWKCTFPAGFRGKCCIKGALRASKMIWGGLAHLKGVFLNMGQAVGCVSTPHVCSSDHRKLVSNLSLLRARLSRKAEQRRQDALLEINPCFGRWLDK